jgi:hypothetical protein
VWPAVLTGVTGLGARSRRSGEAASAGAALLALSAIGAGRTLDELDPPGVEGAADPAAVAYYRGQWARAERAAAAVVALGLDPGTGGDPAAAWGV